MMQRDAVLAFLDAIATLSERAYATDPANRSTVDLLELFELVEAERDRIRGAPAPPWPDGLWHDYRAALVLVQYELATLFHPFPDPPHAETADRVRERLMWLVSCRKEVRAVAEPTPAIH